MKRLLFLIMMVAAVVGLAPLLAGGDSNAAGAGLGPQVVSALGVARVGGQDVLVDVLVVVQPGEDARAAALAGLRSQGARPFGSAGLGSEGFTLTGLFWDSLPVVQNYNPVDEPGGWGQAALTNTHDTWDGVTDSSFDINFGGTTTRCPSLVRECPGKQEFDGFNDVGWAKLKGNTIGVTWFGTTTDEADMALSTNVDWNDGCVDQAGSFDAETVFLHEQGHVVGGGHSDNPDSIMFTPYQGLQCFLAADDEEMATYLYDSSVTGSVSGTVTDGTDDPIVGATVELEGTGLSATTAVDGTYTIDGVAEPVTYTVNGSADGFDSDTIARLTVDGVTTADFTLTAADGDDGGNGGGPPACVPKKFCP